MKQLTILLPLKWREEIRFPMHPKCFPKLYLQKVPFSLFQGFISIVFKSSAALLELRLTRGTLALLSLWKCRHSGLCWTRSETERSQSSPRYTGQKEVPFSQKARKCYPTPNDFSTSSALQLRAEYTETSHLGVSPFWEWREMGSGGRVGLFHFHH